MKNRNGSTLSVIKTAIYTGLLLTIAVFTLGCAGTLGMDTPSPPSSAGLYPDSPTDAPVGTSRNHATISRNYNFTHDEVMDAAKNGLLRMGLTSEESSTEKGMINGSGWWPRSCNPAMGVYTSSTWVLWINAVSPEVTKVTARLDSHGWNCSNIRVLQGSTQEIHTEIAKVLSTY